MVVYSLRNKINGKRYIGCTASDLNRRIAEHCRKFDSPVISRTIRKYGIASFEITVLEECSGQVRLFERESYWIAQFESQVPGGYNVADGGQGFKVGHAVSAKIREMVGSRYRGKKRPEMSVLHTGKSWHTQPHSEESKIKMSRSRALLCKNPEFRKRLSLNATRRAGDPLERKRLSEIRRATPVSLETRKKLSISAKADWARRKAK